MKARRLFSASRTTLLLLFFMTLAACHGGGGGGGTTGLPLPLTTLTVGSPVSDVVVLGSFNFYAASVVPGALYKVSITDLTDDADLIVFDADSTFTVRSQNCAIDNTVIPSPFSPSSPEDCVITASGNVLYFGVDGTFLATSSAAVYTIAVELLTATNLNTSIPLPDTTTPTGAAVYSMPTTTGTVYTVSITGLSDDADLYVFGATCATDNTIRFGTSPEDCTLTSPGGTLLFIVDGLFSTAPTVKYTALAAPAPVGLSPINEDSIATPVDVFADIPRIGQVASAPTGTSYYAAGGLTAGTRYTVSITGLTGDADLNVYDNDNTFKNPANCLIQNTGIVGTDPEDCTLVVSGSTLYFSVTSFTTGVGDAYISLVEPGP